MKEGNVFQTIVVGVFIALGVFGLIFFSLFKSSSEDVDFIGNVNIWGTVDESTMAAVKETLDDLLPKNYDGKIIYTKLEKETLNEELVEAIATGVGPDIVLFDHEDILRQLNKIFEIPFENFSERKFKDTYVEGAEVTIGSNGIYALPFLLDPIIMYWNRDILTKENVVSVPKYWEEFYTLSPKLTKRDQGANILQSTVSFGEYRNVTNAEEVISALIIQAGDPIVERDALTYRSTLADVPGSGVEAPAVSALRFYTQFSDPIKSVYSWNRALKESRQLFASGDLAFYFGFASEATELQRLNPNLNFDIAVIPQIRDDSTPATFGKFTSIALLKSSKNIPGSFRVATLLTTNPVFSTLNEVTGLPPVSRQLLSNKPTDAIQPIFYESAIISRAWLEPDSKKIDIIFRDMIESVTSGRLSVWNSIQEAGQEINSLFSK